MKKVLAGILAILMALSLAACGRKTEADLVNDAMERFDALQNGELTVTVTLSSEQGIVEGFDACVRMKFPLPSGESAVALLRLAGDNLLEAVPVLYSVSPTGGAQGPYRLEHLRREETAPQMCIRDRYKILRKERLNDTTTLMEIHAPHVANRALPEIGRAHV